MPDVKVYFIVNLKNYAIKPNYYSLRNYITWDTEGMYCIDLSIPSYNTLN